MSQYYEPYVWNIKMLVSVNIFYEWWRKKSNDMSEEKELY